MEKQDAAEAVEAIKKRRKRSGRPLLRSKNQKQMREKNAVIIPAVQQSTPPKKKPKISSGEQIFTYCCNHNNHPEKDSSHDCLTGFKL
jgi:hypothetical protein